MNKARLEYCGAAGDSLGSGWSFRFTSADGDIIAESPRRFASREKAEQGFVDMVKLIASNAYSVHGCEGLSSTNS